MVASPPAKPAADRPASDKPVDDNASPPAETRPAIETAFLDYIRSVHRIVGDAQKRGADTYLAYQREVGENSTELNKRLEDLQRDYVASVQEAFGRDDAAVRAEKAYHEAFTGYRQLVEDAQRQAEQVNKKLVTLLNQQGEDLRKQCAQALAGYLRGLQAAMQQLGGASVRVADLEYLSQSIGTVALYAGATGALAQ